MKSIKYQIFNQVWVQVWVQVFDQVGDKVFDTEMKSSHNKNLVKYFENFFILES